jgi:hypothetical protein
MLLPRLGGSPAVWNTAMVFYQAALLAGYAWAHIATGRLRPRRQVVIQLAILLAPLALLPIAVPGGWAPPADRDPVLWVIGVMALTVGAPFFAVCTTSPLLQRWFSTTNHPSAADPYFLYGASNVGSLLALVSYPLLIEPHLHLADQSRYWKYGYFVLAGLTAVCALVAARRQGPATPAVLPLPAAPDQTPIAPGRRLRWVLLAFVPSSLMLGVTTYLSSDVAVIPLLWVVPLALYLATFVLAFARRQFVPLGSLRRIFPLLVVALVLLLNLRATEPIAGLTLLHLATFFAAAMLCHGELAATRPPSSQLTEFYLWMAFGGVLGGVFNALIAPFIFNSVAEYPLALMLASLLILQLREGDRPLEVRWPDLLWPALFAGLASVLAIVGWRYDSGSNPLMPVLALGVPAMICYFLSKNAVRFALGLGATLVGASFYHGGKEHLLYAERTFFGVNRVTLSADGSYHSLVHGVTLHGKQRLEAKHPPDPLTYYYRTGPIGQVCQAYCTGPNKAVGVVGLGAGSLASYAQSGQAWTFYEIDPVVAKLARDPRYFTYLHDSPGEVRVVLGDARLSLTAARDDKFDVLILDAFSSDAIPVHLVTREALALYRQHLKPHGVLAFHISNLHLDLEPVFALLAEDAGLTCLVRDDTTLTPEETAQGKSPSIWVTMAEPGGDLHALAGDPRWRSAGARLGQRVWTDDYSSLISVLRW